MRRRNKPWVDKELMSNPKLVLDPKIYKGKWKEYFGNNNPIYLEIGCGKGRFVVNSALKDESLNFIALEREDQVIANGVRSTRLVLEEQNIDLKIAFILGDADNLKEYFDDSEISRVFLNFSDPWRDRKKWHKRRLTYRKYLNIYQDILVENGELHFKTDNVELFDFSLKEFESCNWKVSNITRDLHNSGFDGNIMTEYEERFSEKGMPIYRCEATRP